jgi:ABC-type Co2+ transport system permease subunit
MTNNTQKKSLPLQVASGLLILGVILASAELILSQNGAFFFRWGTVGVFFYVVSFAGSLALGGEPRLRVCQEALSLRSMALLDVVPLSYFLISLLVIIGGTRVDLFRYGLIAISVLITIFLLARTVEKFSQVIR